jgi:adenylate kinase family enzyme
MSEIIIVCGNMSVGKTTLCQKMSEAMDFHYVYFDSIMHKGYKTSKQKAVSNFASSLDCEQNYIIDGWFSWHKYWFKDSDDDSLSLLDELVPHQITLMIMGIQNNILVDRHKKREYNGINNREYFNELEKRQDAIYNNFSKFTKSKKNRGN